MQYLKTGYDKTTQLCEKILLEVFHIFNKENTECMNIKFVHFPVNPTQKAADCVHLERKEEETLISVQ
jgi:hypothetical protein